MIARIIALIALMAFTACKSEYAGTGKKTDTLAPSALELVSPARNFSSNKNPTIKISGVSLGDRVELFLDPQCTDLIGEETALTDSVEITTQDLSAGDQTFFARVTGPEGKTSLCSSASLSYRYVPCPENYAAVRANPDVGTTSDFCVMTYEAKQVSGAALSSPTGTPWVNITPSNAVIQCTNAGGFLISNEEWMTVAREMEKEDRNWSNGVAGYGTLNRGWSALTSVDTFSNSVPAPDAGDSCIYNTAANACGATGTHTLRRTHYLYSSGEVVWDFSGSVWEFIDWSVSTPGLTPCPLCTYTGPAFKPIQDYITSCLGLTFENASPLNSNLGTPDNVGQIQGNNAATNIAMRGGNWVRGTDAGIYSINMSFGNVANSTRGFRCVTRPFGP